MNSNEHILNVFNSDGQRVYVLISDELWIKIEDKIHNILEESKHKAVKKEKEPLEDWKEFLKTWDFNYPINKEVTCEKCGQNTQDWEKDQPRKFILRTANISGLVAFTCNQCSSKIIKRHFKDKISFECHPFTTLKK